MGDTQTMTARQALDLAREQRRQAEERQAEIDEVVAALRRLRRNDRFSIELTRAIREGWRE